MFEEILFSVSLFISILCFWFFIRSISKWKERSSIPVIIALFYFSNCIGTFFLAYHVQIAENFFEMKHSWNILISVIATSYSYILSWIFGIMLTKSSNYVKKNKKIHILIAFFFIQFTIIQYIAVMIDIGAFNHLILQILIGSQELTMGIYLIIVLIKIKSSLSENHQIKMNSLLVGFFIDRILALILYLLYIRPSNIDTYLIGLTFIMILRAIAYIIIERSYLMKIEE